MTDQGGKKNFRGRLKDFFFGGRRKNAMVFLFFFAMASVFWVIQKLDDPIVVKVIVPVRLVNVPKDVIITTELPTEMNLMVRDKGSELLPLFWKPQLDTLKIDFKEYDTHEITDNTILVPTVLQQILKEKLPTHSTIAEMSPDTLIYAYNRGIHRKLPVSLRGTLIADSQYHLDGYSFTPDSVEVYAPAKILDTLQAAYTEVSLMEDLTQSTSVPVSLIRSRSLRFFPDTVTLNINVDILTRQSIEVYIQGINFPDGKELRTFPATVTVTYLVSATQAKSIDTNLFHVTASYHDLVNQTSTKCKPQLTGMPEGISNAFITPVQVEYLIEDINTEHIKYVAPSELEDNKE